MNPLSSFYLHPIREHRVLDTTDASPAPPPPPPPPPPPGVRPPLPVRRARLGPASLGFCLPSVETMCHVSPRSFPLASLGSTVEQAIERCGPGTSVFKLFRYMHHPVRGVCWQLSLLLYFPLRLRHRPPCRLSGLLSAALPWVPCATEFPRPSRPGTCGTPEASGWRFGRSRCGLCVVRRPPARVGNSRPRDGHSGLGGGWRSANDGKPKRRTSLVAGVDAGWHIVSHGKRK